MFVVTFFGFYHNVVNLWNWLSFWFLLCAVIAGVVEITCRRTQNTDISVCKRKSLRAKMLRRLCAFCAFSGGSFRCGIRPFTVWNTVFCSAVRGLLHTGRRPFIPPNGMYVCCPCGCSHDKSLFFLLYSAVFAVPVLISRHGKQTCSVWQNVACYAVSAYGCANNACWHNGDFRTFYRVIVACLNVNISNLTKYIPFPS